MPRLRIMMTALAASLIFPLSPGADPGPAVSDEQDFEDPHAKSRHLLIGLKAEADGWTNVRLQRLGAGYKPHSVEITPVANPDS